MTPGFAAPDQGKPGYAHGQGAPTDDYTYWATLVLGAVAAMTRTETDFFDDG